MKNKKKKIVKGEYGYIHNQKIRRSLTSLGLFAIPMFGFIGAYLLLGTTRNIFTVIALVGCLPACRSMVGTIMMLLQKPVDPDHYKQISEHAGDLLMAYEMYLTSYEKSDFVESFAFCGNKAAGYSSRIKGSPQHVEDHVKNILKQNGYKADVKVYTDLKQYLERLDYLNSRKEELENSTTSKPDDRYPGMSRTEAIRHIILNISL